MRIGKKRERGKWEETVETQPLFTCRGKFGNLEKKRGGGEENRRKIRSTVQKIWKKFGKLRLFFDISSIVSFFEILQKTRNYFEIFPTKNDKNHPSNSRKKPDRKTNQRTKGQLSIHLSLIIISS